MKKSGFGSKKTKAFHGSSGRSSGHSKGVKSSHAASNKKTGFSSGSLIKLIRGGGR